MCCEILLSVLQIIQGKLGQVVSAFLARCGVFEHILKQLERQRSKSGSIVPFRTDTI